MMTGGIRTTLLAAAITLGAAAAQASAVFDFSFSNEDGAVSGAVAGQVTLPDGDGTFAATDFIVTQAPAALNLASIGFGTPFGLSDFSNVDNNSFVVTGGTITSSDFFANLNGSTAIALGSSIVGGDITFLDAFNCECLGSDGVLDNDSSTLTFSRAPAVPLPAAAPLLGAALMGAGILLRGRRRAG